MAGFHFNPGWRSIQRISPGLSNLPKRQPCPATPCGSGMAWLGQSSKKGVKSTGGDAFPFFKLAADRSSIFNTLAGRLWGETKTLGSSMNEPFENARTRKYFVLARRRLIRFFASAATSYSSSKVTCLPRFSELSSMTTIWWDFPPSSSILCGCPICGLGNQI